MFAFPGMLVSAAKDAGMKTPKDPDEFDENQYPHFHLFCCAQLGQPMPYAGCHFENAKIIANIPDDKLKTITWNDLIAMGFTISTHPTGI